MFLKQSTHHTISRVSCIPNVFSFSACLLTCVSSEPPSSQPFPAKSLPSGTVTWWRFLFAYSGGYRSGLEPDSISASHLRRVRNRKVLFCCICLQEAAGLRFSGQPVSLQTNCMLCYFVHFLFAYQQSFNAVLAIRLPSAS